MKFAWVKEDFIFKNPLSKELMNVLKIYFDQLTKIEKSSLSYKILKTIGEYFRQDSNLENKYINLMILFLKNEIDTNKCTYNLPTNLSFAVKLC